ncbi:MAG: hypothetical protein JEZ08_01800 [Clostridiales bacterium]|nr:hypothetical protein [Clostridiales bacterium]
MRFNDSLIYGDKSKYYQALCFEDNNIEANEGYKKLGANPKLRVFPRYYDLFLVSAIYGFIIRSYTEVHDRNKSDNRVRIPQSVFTNNNQRFEALIRSISFIHLSERGFDKPFEKVIDDEYSKVTDTNRDSLRQEIIEGYADAGVEHVYKSILEDVEDEEDVMSNIIDFVESFKELEIKELNSLDDIVDVLG